MHVGANKQLVGTFFYILVGGKKFSKRIRMCCTLIRDEHSNIQRGIWLYCWQWDKVKIPSEIKPPLSM